MRVTGANAFGSAISNLQHRQQELTDGQEQLTSGKRVRRASDDPAAAARAERAMVSISRSEADLRALNTSRSAMQLTESSLGHAGDLLMQARDQLAAAGNGSYTDSERRTLAESIRGLRNDLLAEANRDDGAGRYLFGGQGADGSPLLDGPTGVTYQGTDGTLQASSGSETPLSLDGRSVWLAAPDPANPATPLSVFGVLDGIVADLLTPGRTSDQIAATVRKGLGDIDTVSDNLGRWRARAGESLRRADDVESRLSQGKLDAQRERSSAEDLDMVEAVSSFQARQTSYDAALKAYSIVQRMTLFEYLR